MIQRETIVFILIAAMGFLLLWYSHGFRAWLRHHAERNTPRIQGKSDAPEFLIVMAGILIILMAIIGALDSMQ